MSKIFGAANAAVSAVGVEHIRDKDVFDADIVRLKQLQLSKDAIRDPNAKNFINEFQQLGRAYVNTVMQFIAHRNQGSAENLYRLSKTIKRKIIEAQAQFPEEPAFARTKARPEAQTQSELKACEHVGTIFNSMFATFASSTFFPEYLEHYAEFERKAAANGVKIDAI